MCTSQNSGLVGAIERGRARLNGWTRDGTLVTLESFAAGGEVSCEALREALAHGELFTIEVEGHDYLPAELLKLRPEERAAICQALAGVSPSSRLVFLLRNHGALAGKSVADALPIMGLPRVVQLAQSWQES